MTNLRSYFFLTYLELTYRKKRIINRFTKNISYLYLRDVIFCILKVLTQF